MTTDQKPPSPNRYGAIPLPYNGELCCRHSVSLWKNCERCNELLGRVRNPEREGQDQPDWEPELPTLVGTGDTLD